MKIYIGTTKRDEKLLKESEELCFLSSLEGNGNVKENPLQLVKKAN